MQVRKNNNLTVEKSVEKNLWQMTPAVAPHPAKPETTPWFHKLYHLLFPQKNRVLFLLKNLMLIFMKFQTVEKQLLFHKIALKSQEGQWLRVETVIAQRESRYFSVFLPLIRLAVNDLHESK